MYTVTEVAEILKLHPKTVRKKILEGKINAVRVGGQYRISQEEIDSIFGKESKETTPFNFKKTAIVSSIVDIEVFSKEESMRMTNTIVAALNSGDMNININCVYYEKLNRLKIMVNCGIESAPETLLMIRSLLNVKQVGTK